MRFKCARRGLPVFSIVAAVVTLGVAAAFAGDVGATKRTPIQVELPKVTLKDRKGADWKVKQRLGGESAMAVQFIFTTCPTICPASTAIFSRLQQKLKEAGVNVELVSISIDPDHDTPKRMAEYAKNFKPADGWSFVTGTAEQSAAVQKAFGVYKGDKMWHDPLTIIKPRGKDAQWVRVDGMLTPDQLFDECKRIAGR